MKRNKYYRNHSDYKKMNEDTVKKTVEADEADAQAPSDKDSADIQEVTAEAVAEQENIEMDDLHIKVDKLTSDLEKEKKEYLFLMAEFDNFRKRTLRERSELIKNAAESVLKGLLPIVDDFERGLEAASKTDDAQSVAQGMELIYNKLVKYLEQNGVKAMKTNGEPFDADMHEAVAMVPAPSEEQKGKILDTIEKGYTLNDKVLRHAKVAVAQS